MENKDTIPSDSPSSSRPKRMTTRSSKQQEQQSNTSPSKKKQEKHQEEAVSSTSTNETTTDHPIFVEPMSVETSTSVEDGMMDASSSCSSLQLGHVLNDQAMNEDLLDLSDDQSLMVSFPSFEGALNSNSPNNVSPPTAKQEGEQGEQGIQIEIETVPQKPRKGSLKGKTVANSKPCGAKSKAKGSVVLPEKGESISFIHSFIHFCLWFLKHFIQVSVCLSSLLLFRV